MCRRAFGPDEDEENNEEDQELSVLVTRHFPPARTHRGPAVKRLGNHKPAAPRSEGSHWPQPAKRRR